MRIISPIKMIFMFIRFSNERNAAFSELTASSDAGYKPDTSDTFRKYDFDCNIPEKYLIPRDKLKLH